MCQKFKFKRMCPTPRPPPNLFAFLVINNLTYEIEWCSYTRFDIYHTLIERNSLAYFQLINFVVYDFAQWVLVI